MKEYQKKLNDEKELLELELYKSLPNLESKIYPIKEISKEIPNNGVLIEYQKYRPFIFDNPSDAFYLSNDLYFRARVHNENSSISTYTLGGYSVKLIENSATHVRIGSNIFGSRN